MLIEKNLANFNFTIEQKLCKYTGEILIIDILINHYLLDREYGLNKIVFC
jgi:hypothetical protein